MLMRDIVRHRLLLSLSNSIYKHNDTKALPLPKLRLDVLNVEGLNNLKLFDSLDDMSLYLPETLGECIQNMTDEDYEVLKAYVYGIQHDGINTSRPHNLVLSGGGGKGICYSGLIKFLDEETVFSTKKTDIENYLCSLGVSDFSKYSIPEPQGEMTPHELESFLTTITKEGKPVFDRLSTSYHRYSMVQKGFISKKSGLENVKAISGTSAGAITALPVALGLNFQEYSKLIRDSQFNHFFIDGGKILPRLLRAAGNKMFRSEYTRRFSELYILNIRKNLGKILPEACNEESINGNSSYIDSLLKGTTREGINYLHRHVVSSGMLNELYAQTERDISNEISSKRIVKISHLMANRIGKIKKIKRSRRDFYESGGFKEKTTRYTYRSSQSEAFFISLFSASDIDNISEYFGRLISNKIKDVGISRVSPILSHQRIMAYTNTPESAKEIINNAISFLKRNNLTVDDKSIYKCCLRMCTYHARDAAFSQHPYSELHMEGILLSWGYQTNNGINKNQRSMLDDSLLLIDSLYRDNQRLVSLQDLASTPHELRRFISKSNLARHTLDEIFLHKCSNITFKDLHAIKNRIPEAGIKDLYVTGTAVRLLKGKWAKTVYFSHKENSDMPIQDAIRGSMSLPAIFKKTRWKGLNLRDGGFYENTPHKPFESNPSTLIAVAEDDAFYRRSPTYFRAWARWLLPRLHKKMNEFKRSHNISDVLRTVFLSSKKYSTVDFSFATSDISRISLLNSELMKQDRAITKDAMYYFLYNREKTHSVESSMREQPHIYPGIFGATRRNILGRDRYAEDMLKYAKEFNFTHDI